MRPRCLRGSRKLFLATVPIAAALCAPQWARAQTTTIDLPPLNGFQPLVIVGMTDEQAGAGDLSFDAFFAHPSSTPGGNGVPSNNLPIGGPQAFYIAIIDTGAQVNLINDATANQINFVSANRDGSNPLIITGASGSETATIADAVGFYMTDLSHGTSGATLSVPGGTQFKGMWNASPAITPPTSALPNIMGSPVVGLYQTIIKNSQPTHVTVGSTTYKSPQVSFSAINTAVPSGYGKVALTTTNNVGGPPALFPSDLENYGNDPAQPTIWESLFANVTVNHTAGSSAASFLYDTGAQVSVLSSDTAANVGIYTAGENPTPPDFTTEITGVGGTISTVNGYYINSFSMTSTGGPLNFARVPIVVLDLPDPRNPNNTLPGVIGTNLFGARDLIINIDTNASGQTGLWVSPQIAWKFNGSGNWSDSSKWNVVLPSGIDTQANFFGAITTAQTVTLDNSYAVGSVSFDNVNRYTVNGPGAITLDVSVDNAQINVGNGSHTINANMTFADDTELNVNAQSSVLTMTGDVTATAKTIIKNGPGTAEMKNIRAGGLNVQQGKLTVLQNGGQTGTSKVSSLTIANGGRLDLKDNDLVVTGGPVGTVTGTTYSGITGMVQAGRNGGGWAGTTGIVTSMTAATSGNYTTLGVAKASDVRPSTATATATWSGQTITGTDVLVMYTYGGDANLDGKINVDDYIKIDFGSSAHLAGWVNGDFNYDGKINIDDYQIIDGNIPIQGPGLLASGGLGDEVQGLTAIPEPAAIAALAIFGAGFSVHRRRRRP